MNRLHHLLIAIIIIALTPFTSFSQSVSINTDGSTANASAMLDVKSTSKGLLIPRMSRAERDAIAAPATGLLIFQNAPDSIGYYYYNGTAWTWLLSNSNADSLAWRTGGNTGLTSANFLGTKDNSPLIIKTNNTEQLRILPGGEMGIGTTTPNATYGNAKMEIAHEGNNGISDLLLRHAGSSATYSSGFIIQRSRGTLAAPTANVSGDYLGAASWVYGHDGTNYKLSATIDAFTDGTVATNKVPGALYFGTTDTGGAYAYRMALRSDGKLGVGLTSPSAQLDVAGNGSGTNSLLLRSGNSSGSFVSNQVLFGWNGTNSYRHAIKTRHHSGIPNQNSIDFYLWNQGVDAAGTIGTKAAMTIDGKWKGMVGIGTTTPNSELHISDGSTSLKSVTDGGGFGASMLITDNNIPRIYFEAAGEPVDKKLMDLTYFGQSLRIGALNDAGSAFLKSDILVINRAGNVGIGVSAPAVALDVAGSATVGTGNTNTGTKTIAAGNGNNLSGNNSIVTGESNTVTAIRSMVSGGANTVGGENNIVSGLFNSITGAFGHSIIVGYQDTVSNSSSAAFGYLNKVNGFTGFAAGDRNFVSAQNGTAFGYQNATSGTSAFVTGVLDTAAGNTSAAFGTGNMAASYNEFVLGMYGSNYTPVSASSYDVADRLFNIGNGTSSVARADAFTILKGGNVGIGTASPTALLDVNSNTIRLRSAKTPSSSSDTGNTGDIAWDSNYIYVCVATNTWKRVAIASW